MELVWSWFGVGFGIGAGFGADLDVTDTPVVPISTTDPSDKLSTRYNQTSPNDAETYLEEAIRVPSHWSTFKPGLGPIIESLA